MPKMKQATLFSLKSWKKVAIEDIRKYKDILDKPDEAVGEILQALSSLKKKNLNKDVILSVGIDVTIRLLEKHPSPKVAYEAHMLRRCWQLRDLSSVQANLVAKEEAPVKCINRVPEIEICRILTVNQSNESHKTTERCKLEEATTNLLEKQLNNELCLTQSNKRRDSATTKYSKQVFKKESVNKVAYRNIIQRLHEAVKIFTQEIGEQEVISYLKMNHLIK